MLRRPGFSFSFDPSACEACQGKCCREAGTVRVGRAALVELAAFLGLPAEVVVERYLEKRGYGWSLREVPVQEGGVACVFFEDGCSVYAARPPQCRDYPFWDELRGGGPALEKCPGIRPL